MWFQFSSVQFSCSVVSNSLRPQESQHTRPPCPSPTPGVYSNSCPSSQWCHPAISSSVTPFSSCPQSLPTSGSFSMSQLFTWGGQNIQWTLKEASICILLLFEEASRVLQGKVVGSWRIQPTNSCLEWEVLETGHALKNPKPMIYMKCRAEQGFHLYLCSF